MQFEPLEGRQLMAGDLSVVQALDSQPQATETIEVTLAADILKAEAQVDDAVVLQHDSSDVNRDEEITALDALMVINFLNNASRGEGNQTVDASNGGDLNEALSNPYDVNLDGRVTAVDALWVINIVNQTDASNRLGGCSCGGVGCPACLAPVIQWLPGSVVGTAVEQAVGSEVVVSGI